MKLSLLLTALVFFRISSCPRVSMNVHSSKEKRDTEKKNTFYAIKINDSTLHVPTRFLRRLFELKRVFLRSFSKRQWSRLTKGAVVRRDRKKILNTVSSFFLNVPLDGVTVGRALERLISFDAGMRVYGLSTLFSSLALAEHYEYKRIDELCKAVFVLIRQEVLPVEDLLLVSTKDEQNTITEHQQNTITEHEEMKNYTRRYRNSKNNKNFNAEKLYSQLSTTYNLKWQVSRSLFRRILSEKRVLALINKHCIRNQEENELLNDVIFILRIRVLDLPEEKKYYNTCFYVFNFYSTPEFATDKFLPTVFNAVHSPSSANRSQPFSDLVWSTLTLTEASNTRRLLSKSNDRTVNLLELVSYNDEPFTRGRAKNRIVVRDELVVDNVEGEIDFVEIQGAKRIVFKNVKSVRFYSDDSPTRFESIRVVVLVCSLLTILADNHFLMSPSVKFIALERCEVTTEIEKAVPWSTRWLFIVESVFSTNLSVESVVRGVRTASVYAQGDSYRLYKLVPEESLIRKVKRLYGINATRRSINRIVYVHLPIETSKEELEASFSGIRRRRKLATCIISVTESAFYGRINFIASVEGKIVFLKTEFFKEYVILKRIFRLKSLSYLHTKYVKSCRNCRIGINSRRHNNNCIDPDDDNVVPIHALRVLIIAERIENYHIKIINKAFRWETLEALKFTAENRKELDYDRITCYSNIRLLQINVFFDLKNADNDMTMLASLSRLTKLEVLQLKINEIGVFYRFPYNIETILQEIVDGCSTLRSLLVQFSQTNNCFRRVQDFEIRSRSGRVYCLCVRPSCYKRYDEYVSSKAIKSISEELYRKRIMEKVIREKSKRLRGKERQKTTDWLYELIL